MAFDLPVLRIFLYIVLIVFSVVELGLCAARLQYTTHLKVGDPLNDGIDFYDPIVAELLFTTLVTMFWSVHAVRTIHGRYEHRYYISTFGGELFGLFLLFLFWIVGAGIASSIWGDLSFCHQYETCRLLTALVAFAWLGWTMVFFLLLMNVLFSFANNAFGEPMHGRWDPRVSHYRESQGNYPQQTQVTQQQSGIRRFVPW